MFSRKEQLLQKTGEEGVGRYEYLKQLINEFTTTRSQEAKQQTIANLSNFAYDPINYEFFKQLHITDLFLAQLSEEDEDLMHFALAGLCNLSCDPEIQHYIISLNGVHLLSEQLLNKNEEIALNALTTLYYLVTNENKASIITSSLINKARHFENSDNQRLRNLGTAFLKKVQ